MNAEFGHTIRLSLFGESHGPAIGCTLSGLPPGFAIDWEAVARDMARRRPGQGPLATARREPDEWEILSGWFEGKTTGAPLTMIIRNGDTRSADYAPDYPRPGHADYAASLRYGGHADYRGGGRFSGRLTAPLVLAGGVAKQLIRRHGVRVGARIARIAGIADGQMPAEEILSVSRKPFPVYDDRAGGAMQAAILQAKKAGDSVGGVIECAAYGCPAGLGDPLFGSLEGEISRMMFAIPAVKGLEFGDGFALSDRLGSEANDPMEMRDGRVRHTANHNGGILGGITNGEPILLRVAIKPTPTIAQPQTTVDLAAGRTVAHAFGGRHDPCVVPRAVPVVEAGLALCLLDCLTGIQGALPPGPPAGDSSPGPLSLPHGKG